MAQKQGCDSCRSDGRPTLVQVGEPKHEEYFGGKASETITRYRCSLGGTIWERLRESGAGGHGKFWNIAPDQGS